MDVTFLWLMVGIKIPIVVLGIIIWRAVRDVPEPESAADDGSGGSRRHPHPRAPLPRPPRRGPHSDPRPTPPQRVRPVPASVPEPHDGSA